MESVVKAAPRVGDKLTFIRSFAAPRELVFKLWTDPVHLARWWGPAGFTNPVCEFDPRPGGRIYIAMTGPDGTAYPMTGVVREIVAPERLVMTNWCCHDKSGVPGIEVLTTANFVESGKRTKLFLEARVMKADPSMFEALDGMEQGWSETLDRLSDAVATL